MIVLLVMSVAACEDRRLGDSDETDTARVDTPDLPLPPVEPGVGENGAARPGVTVPEIVDASSARSDTGELRILDRMNEPRRTEVETRPNRHQRNRIDTVRTHHFEGLSLSVYHVADGKELLETLRITDSAYETEEGVRVGSSHDEVERRLGSPEREEDGAYVYEFGEGMPTLLFVHFDAGEVEELVWQFPID